MTDARLGTSATMNNMTRMMAVLLFSGQIMNWSDFGPNYPSIPAVICLRHSGSGTHSTLDYAIVKGNGWGSTLAGYENRPDDTDNYDSGQSVKYFNDTTGDELTCVNGQTGAIGYADADKANATTHAVSGYSNTLAIMYQGEYPTSDAVKNGRYDFWTNEWAYKDPTLSGAQLTFVNSLLTYAAGHIPTSELPFWVDQTTMTFEKATDQQYPHK